MGAMVVIGIVIGFVVAFCFFWVTCRLKIWCLGKKSTKLPTPSKNDIYISNPYSYYGGTLT
jgi:hypothetical protein